MRQCSLSTAVLLVAQTWAQSRLSEQACNTQRGSLPTAAGSLAQGRHQAAQLLAQV